MEVDVGAGVWGCVAVEEGELVSEGRNGTGDGDGTAVALPQAARIRLAAIRTNALALAVFMPARTPRVPALISGCLFRV